ncbi:hypothetical protein [Paraburkholderia rhynchosiae]|uniref:hypothetical protein n=1 Tax=Paraburkholderia rhynchosiae TaxID=487049 RepID=UPI001FC99E1F|nr:hypothetical protein [Paraburkholderia rhynchosiae]
MPPPFGSGRRLTSSSEPRAPQRAIPGAPRYTASANRRSRLPSNAKFLFFYKLPQRSDHSNRFDEQLAEARRYLEADNVRPRSSRSDRVLGATIFVGCSIVLAWLLATCSTHDAADKLTTAARGPATAVHASPDPARSLAEVQSRLVKASARATEASQSIVQSAPSVANPLRQSAHRAEPMRLLQRAEPQPSGRAPRHIAVTNRLAKTDRPVAIVPITQSQIEQQTALSHSIVSPARPSVPEQPEWGASQSSAQDSAERAALLDWAAQQRRANVSTRASMPVPVPVPVSKPGDVDWNAHMTQRRITDNPAAFQASGAQQ